MVDDIAKAVAMLFVRMIKPTIAVLRWTYLWIVFGAVAILGVLPWAWLQALVMLLALVLWVLLFLQRIIRLITRNPSFSIFRRAAALRKKEKRAIDPEPPEKLRCKEPAGMFFGKKGRDFICKPQTIDGAALVIGGAGSGKSSCIAIKTIRHWGDTGAILAIDIKGELAEKGLIDPARRERTKIFNPSVPSSYGFDPFYLAKQGNNLVQDVREIAIALIEEPPQTKEPFWIRSAQNIFAGAMLYGIEKGVSFTGVVDWLQHTDPQEAVTEIRDCGSDRAAAFVGQYCALKTETLGSIWSEMMNHLLVFGIDDDVRRALDNPKTITPVDLENGCNIFLQLEENKLEQWRSLLTLIINQFLKAFERRPEKQAPILMLLDEAPRLGKLRLVEALSTLRSRQIHIMTFVQSVAQLDLIYGQDARKVITDNCAYKAILGASDADTREWLSKLVGTYDRLKTSRSHNQQMERLGSTLGVSQSEEEKRIIKPEAFGSMTDIVLIHPFTPGFCRIEKAPYYLDKN